MQTKSKTLILLCGAAMMTLTTPLFAKPQVPAHGGGGGGGGGAKQAAASHGGGGGGAKPAATRSADTPRSNAKSSVNTPGNHGGGNTVVKGGNKGGNTVNNVHVDKNVNVSGNGGHHPRPGYPPPPHGYHGGGYYSNGRYYDSYWDDDDGLGFVGKVAVTTAAVAVTAAVVGSVSNTKPDNCQQVIAYDTVYMYCNGTYYQPMQSGSSTSYVVVNAPR